MLFLYHTFPSLLSLSSSLSRTLNHTQRRVISTNLEEVEELNAHNYTSIQTYVSQSQMPSMCEMGVTPLEVSLFVTCVFVSQHFGDHPHRSQWLCNIPPLLIISRRAFACRAYRHQILFPTVLVWYEVRSNPSVLWGMRRSLRMDSWLHRTAEDELFSHTLRALCCLLLGNKWVLLWCYHTESPHRRLQSHFESLTA